MSALACSTSIRLSCTNMHPRPAHTHVLSGLHPYHRVDYRSTAAVTLRPFLVDAREQMASLAARQTELEAAFTDTASFLGEKPKRTNVAAIMGMIAAFVEDFEGCAEKVCCVRVL